MNWLDDHSPTSTEINCLKIIIMKNKIASLIICEKCSRHFFLLARLLNLLGNLSLILIMLFSGRVLILYAMPCLVINVISYAVDVIGEKFLLRSSIYSKCLIFIKNGSFSLIFMNMGASDLTWMNIQTSCL